jgi:hypothetical protein
MQGLLLHVIIHSAGVQNRDRGILLLATLFGQFPFLGKLFADSAYQGIGRHRLLNFGWGDWVNIVIDRSKLVSDFEGQFQDSVPDRVAKRDKSRRRNFLPCPIECVAFEEFRLIHGGQVGWPLKDWGAILSHLHIVGGDRVHKPNLFREAPVLRFKNGWGQRLIVDLSVEGADEITLSYRLDAPVVREFVRCIVTV